jgi:hypothetical protein
VTDTLKKLRHTIVADWRRARLRVLSAITIACAAVISFNSIRNLAHREGFDWLSWIFPVILDAVAAVGMDLWISGSKAWHWAAALASTTVLMSTAANAWDHFSSTDPDGPGPLTGSYVAAGLGALPPAMLAFLLIVLHKHAKGLRDETPAEAPPATTAPVYLWSATTTVADKPPTPLDYPPNVLPTRTAPPSAPATAQPEAQTPATPEPAAAANHPAPDPTDPESRQGPLTEEELTAARAIISASPTTVGRTTLAVAMNVGVSRARAILARLKEDTDDTTTDQPATDEPAVQSSSAA